jgi:hypothetical protein
MVIPIMPNKLRKRKNMYTKIQSPNKIIANLLRGILTSLLALTIGTAGAGQTLHAAAGGLSNVESVSSLAVATNDAFPGTQITGIPFNNLDVDASGATTAGTDPTPIVYGDCDSNQGIASVWYHYTPPVNTYIFIDTIGSNYDTVLSVWTGSEGSLSLVTCNDDISLDELQSKVNFSAQAGITYFIEVIEFTQPASQIQAARTLNFRLSNTGVVFDDVPASYWAFSWIQDLFFSGVTGGCSITPRLYCPAGTVTRDQMAVFLLKAKHGISYGPPPATGTMFFDVPINHWAAAWIEQLARESITSGCGGANYCPAGTVNRDQMAIFLTKTFSLP